MKPSLKKRILTGMTLACLVLPSASFAAEQETPTQETQQEESSREKKLQAEIKELQAQIEEQSRRQNELLDEIDRLQWEQEAMINAQEKSYSYPANSNFLVRPEPDADEGYLQDAINAQGDSTMVFAYTPSQLYKIYCKLNYLTDICLKDGEQITFVGGGDTGKWMLDASTVEGTPHLYLKPIAKGAKTNLIINTTHHTYQVLCEESDWYNPIIKWSYGTEEMKASLQMARQNAQMSSGTVTGLENLNFNYSISGDAEWKPSEIFDDGKRTWIKFRKRNAAMPVLFVREPGKKEAMIVNYHTKNDCIVIDRTFQKAELRLGKDIVKITAER